MQELQDKVEDTYIERASDDLLEPLLVTDLIYECLGCDNNIIGSGKSHAENLAWLEQSY